MDYPPVSILWESQTALWLKSQYKDLYSLATYCRSGLWSDELHRTSWWGCGRTERLQISSWISTSSWRRLSFHSPPQRPLQKQARFCFCSYLFIYNRPYVALSTRRRLDRVGRGQRGVAGVHEREEAIYANVSRVRILEMMSSSVYPGETTLSARG